MSVEVPSRWGPRWSRWVGRFLARVYWNTDVRGRGNVPKDGAAIVVINHVGLIDGPVAHGVIPRGSHFLIREGMFTGVLGVLLRGAQQIRVEGDGRKALAQGLAVLRRGDVVGVFPEGTRGSGTGASVHGGAAWLAVQSGAVVVPTCIVGSRRTGESVNVWPAPRRRLVVAFGEPIHLDLPPHVKGRARQALAQEQVAAALQAQVARTLETTHVELPQDDPSRERAVEEDTP